MLDKCSLWLLEQLNDFCPNGKYTIIEEKELMELFYREIDREGLKHHVSFLSSRELIGVKYAERGTYCICVLPAGRSLLEEIREKKRDKIRRVLYPLLFSFIGAFWGSFLVGLLFHFFQIGWLIC